MRMTIGATLLAISTGFAGAQEHPTLGQVVDTVENSALSYDCQLRGEVLHCQFAQGRVSKGEPKTAQALDAQAGEMLATVTDEQCKGIRDLNDRVSADPPSLPMVPEAGALDDLRNMMAAYTTFCETRSAVAARAAVGAIENKERRTCSFSVYLFELDFTWSYQTERWETVSSPQGMCGIVTAAFMEPDRAAETMTFWNYRQQKFATNKSGEDLLFGKCADYPDSELTGTWQGRELYPQCDYVKFSPF
jgi:hypothetical protein